MKIYFGMRSTRDIIMRHGVLTAGATWATDRLGLQASRSNIPIDFYADGHAAYISSISFWRLCRLVARVSNV